MTIYHKENDLLSSLTDTVRSEKLVYCVEVAVSAQSWQILHAAEVTRSVMSADAVETNTCTICNMKFLATVLSN